MDVENLAKELILKNMTPEQQMAVLDSVRSSVAQAKEVQKRKIGENVDLVVQALKKIESDIRSRFDDVGNSIEKRVASIKDGRDGINGKDGRDGKDGRSGKDGAKGDRGDAGRDGRDGVDGTDGVSVTAARIDFDGSLVITLSSGRELNVGEVVAPDLAERIKVITNGGGTSQSVLDTLASLQTQINNLIPSQTGNSGKFLTTNGSILSWGSAVGGLSYEGTWNASTNTPTLTSSVGTNGYYYVVDTAGSTNLNGITDWKAGDWLIFNGTVWQKIDQSWAIAGANDNITSMTGITGGISSPDFIQFDTAATVTNATGKLYYNAEDQFQTLSFQMNGNQVQHIGEELYYRVKLSSGATKGQVLMFTGTLGASGGLTAAPATGLQPEQASYILGVAAETGSTNDWVFVTTFGEVKSINTTGGAESWAQGDVLYYNPSVTGGLTKTKPSVPNAICLVAAVVHVGSSNGVLFVRPTYGSVLGGTDGNVNFTSLASGNTLIYDAVAGVWENAFLTDGTGISITEGAGSITVGLASGYGDTLNPYASKTANYVLASPNGSAGVPTFRALVAADVPTLNQNTTGSAATLTTPRAIYGNNFDGSAALTQVIASTYGGTGNGFTKFTGATTAERTYTLPDASSTIVVQGGALGTPSSGTVTNLTGTASININGTVGATTPAAGTFTSISDSGNLTFTGTGNRITGDFSNATIANTVLFQTSTVNGGTSIGAIPNGTATASFVNLLGLSAADNCNRFSMQVYNGSEVSLRSVGNGTYTYLPMTFYTGGSERVRIDTSGNVGIGTNSPSAQLHVKNAGGNSISILGQYGSGTIAQIGAYANQMDIKAYNGTNDVMTFTTGTLERMRIDSSGNVGVGVTTPDVIRLRSRGQNTSSSNYALWAENSTPTMLFSARNDGYISTGLAANSPYNATIGLAANLHVFSTDGGLYRATSSIKYKRDVVDYTRGLDAISNLRPVFYKGVNPIEGETVYAGFIAEEVHEAGLTEFVQYAGDGTPDALSYGNMVSLCIKAIQEQQAIIQTLTDRITALEKA